MLCTSLNEWIARVFELRSKNLERGLKQLLADNDKTGLVKDVLSHPLIKASAAHDKEIGPSYIASETFARVLVDLIDKKSEFAAKKATSRDEIIDALNKAKLPDEVELALSGLIDNANTNIDGLRENIQQWFDNSMDRISGWYKRNLQFISLIVALVLTVSFNVDTIAIGKSLWIDPVLREEIVNQAAKAVETCRGKENAEDCRYLNEAVMARDALMKLPVGWPVSIGEGSLVWLMLVKLIGWLITAFAVSLGAPFWFDVLDKMNSIRSSGIKPSSVSKQT